MDATSGNLRGILLIVAVGLASYLGTRIGSAPTASSPASGPSRAPDVDLSRCASALERIVERMEAAPLGGPSKRETGGAESPVSGTSPAAVDLTDLQAAIVRLTSSLASAAQVVNAGSGARTLSVPETTADPREIEAVKQLEEGERMKRYILWPAQRLLDTFGKPDFVRPIADGGVRWYYGPENGERLSFWIHEGLVAQVY
jgi:hypothetical protein